MIRVHSALLNEIRWWHVALVLGAPALIPVFRAVAVVLIAKCVKPEIAKLAIPLVLRPVRPSIFHGRKTAELVPSKTPGTEIESGELST